MPQTVTNHTLRAMYGALSILGNRRLPTVTADVKVGRLLRALAPVVDPLQVARQRIVADVLADRDPNELSPLEARTLEAEVVKRQAELDAQLAPEDFRMPAGMIELADLPAAMTGAEGWKNAEALGAITADLGPLFIFSDQ